MNLLKLYYLGLIFFSLFSFYSCSIVKLLWAETLNNPYYINPTHLNDTIKFFFPEDSQNIITSMKLNNNDISFDFDSGNQRTIINNKTYKRKKNYENVKVINIMGSLTEAKRVKIKRIQIGSIFYCNHLVNYISPNDINMNILGGDILKNFIWKLDFENELIIILNKTDSVYGFKSSAPIKIINNVPYVTCNINGTDIECMIDTGYNGFLELNSHNISKLGLDTLNKWFIKTTIHERTSVINDSTIVFDTLIFTKSNVKIDSIQMPDELITIGRSNLIGLGFLRNFNYVVLDYINNKIYFGDKIPRNVSYFYHILSFYNTMGCMAERNNYLTIKAINKTLKDSGIDLNDTIMYINNEKIFGRDSSFYKSKPNLEFKESSRIKKYFFSQYDSVMIDFYFLKDTSELKIKKGNNFKTVEVVRNQFFNNIPNQIHGDLKTNKLIVSYLRNAEIISGWKIMADENQDGGYWVYKLLEK